MDGENLKTKSSKNPFIKPGIFLKEYKNDKLYDFKNFEFLKLGNELNIVGSGSFGEVFLVKNLKNCELYAIKKVFLYN